ncbi:MAG: PAS domain S-box protein [Bacteroidales bacterium]|nr:PAS domain S-box protein [Bacteroidales bacterium]
MKLLRNKIIILVSIASLVSVGIITFIHLYFSSSVERIKRSYAESQVQLLQNHIIANSAITTDALIYLSENKDIQPCQIEKNGLPQDIGDRLAMAGFSFVIITKPGFSPIAGFPKDDEGIYKMIPADRHIFNKALSDGKVTMYYQWKNDSLFELSAIAVPGCVQSKTDSIGAWIIAGRYMNEELTDRLIMQIPGRISVQRTPEASGSYFNTKTNVFISILPLYGWDNLPAASLRIETQPEIMEVLSVQQKSLLIILIVMISAFLVFIYMYLNRYYILPLRLVSLALKQKDPEYIRMISDTDPDFNSLQNMLINVFNQERLLSDMMKRRSSDHMNSFHAAILSKISEAVYATDHKGTITYWNKAAEDLYGTTEPDAISKIAQVLIKNKWKNPEEEQHMTESLRSSGIWQGRFIQELPDGSEINVEASISCLYDNNDNLLGHLTIVRKPYR